MKKQIKPIGQPAKITYTHKPNVISIKNNAGKEVSRVALSHLSITVPEVDEDELATVEVNGRFFSSPI